MNAISKAFLDQQQEQQPEYITNEELERIVTFKKKAYQESQKLGEKNAKAVTLIHPSGEEKEFKSAMAASRFLGGSIGLVSSWLKNGDPVRGKWKGYSVRLK